MLLHVVVCAALASSAFANFTANNFLDNVLRDLASQTRSTGLDPSLVNSFALKVKASGFTNRDFKANFTRGSLVGLSQLRRQGNCSYGVAGSELRMGCYVTLGSLQFLMNADVKGDQISGNNHSIATSSRVSGNTFALIELAGRRGFPARVAGLSIRPVTMTTTVIQGKIDLNGSRFNDFVKQTNDNLVRQLSLILNGRYASVLGSVANRSRMP